MLTHIGGFLMHYYAKRALFKEILPCQRLAFAECGFLFLLRCVFNNVNARNGNSI